MDRLVRHRPTKGPVTDRPILNNRVTPRLYFQSILPGRIPATAPPDSSIGSELDDWSRAKHRNAASDWARSQDATPRASAPTPHWSPWSAAAPDRPVPLV